MYILSKELNSSSSSSFSEVYPYINKYIVEDAPIQNSRNGRTKEILNFKTHITNPIQRCVGGYNRDINIFFLLAEALWIFVGRKDVDFLTIFNSNMSNFSDDKKVFHAPYGFRLRHWGVAAEDKPKGPETSYELEGLDQVNEALKMLSSDKESRRCVLSIWNPDLDLVGKSLDIPCNDLLMYKVRDNKLILTVCNRSNDLHWGLPTNVFQFSFLSEIMAKILDLSYGEQTHLSQSLHAYTDNQIANEMYLSLDRAVKSNNKMSLYDFCIPKHMDFKFSGYNVESRLAEVDTHIHLLIALIENMYNGGQEEKHLVSRLQNFSEYLYNVYVLLKIYVLYRRGFESDKSEISREDFRKVAYNNLLALRGMNADYHLLALNFFNKRIKDVDFLDQTTPSNLRRYLGNL